MADYTALKIKTDLKQTVDQLADEQGMRLSDFAEAMVALWQSATLEDRHKAISERRNTNRDADLDAA